MPSHLENSSHLCHIQCVSMHCEVRAAVVRSSLTQGHVDRMVSTEKSGNSSIHLWVKYPMAMLGMEISQEPNPGLSVS